MKIKEKFIKEILKEEFPQNYQFIYDNSPLMQYLDKKMKAVHGDSKSRRNLANIYAIYSILHFYQKEYYNQPDKYRNFRGFRYSDIKEYSCSLYGGSKLQNHAFNNRINGEFRNRFPNTANDLFITANGKYLLHIDYLYVGQVDNQIDSQIDSQIDISKTCCHIIERYIELIKAKDRALFQILREMQSSTDYSKKKEKIQSLLSENAEARIFEIISYAVLKNHYKNQKVYLGDSLDAIQEKELLLYKTGRTNANDGGIDFVMRPIGRFFQELNDYIHKRASGMLVIEERYHKAIEEIITINELLQWTDELSNPDIDNIIQDIDIYYRLEMNMNDLGDLDDSEGLDEE